jgi:predicted small lipoprotein YifL
MTRRPDSTEATEVATESVARPGTAGRPLGVLHRETRRSAAVLLLTALAACGYDWTPVLPGDAGPDVGDAADIDAGPTDATVDHPETGPDVASPPEAACDLASPKNCGACGVDCSLGECNAGICTLFDATRAGASLGLTTLLNVSGVVLTSGNDLFLSQVFVCPSVGCLANGPGKVTLGVGNMGITDIVALFGDGPSSFLWGAHAPDGTGGIYRTAVDGGGTMQLFAGSLASQPVAVVAAGDRLVWATNGNEDDASAVASCPLAGCSDAGPLALPIRASYSSQIQKLATSGASGFLWAGGPGVGACTDGLCTGGSSVLATGPSGSARPATFGQTVFYAFGSGITAEELDGGGARTAVGALPMLPSDILVVGDALYWSLPGTRPPRDQTGGYIGLTKDGLIQRCHLPACSDVVTLAQGQSAPVALSTDGRAIYWTNAGVQYFGTGKSSVCKAPL